MPSNQTYPAILAGQDLTAGLLASMLEVTSWKAANTSVTSSTTLASDPDLVVAVAANATYEFRMWLAYTGGTQGSSDLKGNFAFPSGSTFVYGHTGLGLSSGGYQVGYYETGTGGFTAGTLGTGANATLPLEGTLFTGGTAGSLQFQWAQNTSSATATTVFAGSRMSLRRLA